MRSFDFELSKEITIAPSGRLGRAAFFRCLLTGWGKCGKIKVVHVDMDTMTQGTVLCVTVPCVAGKQLLRWDPSFDESETGESIPWNGGRR